VSDSAEITDFMTASAPTPRLHWLLLDDREAREKEPSMMIIGCDFDPSFQQIAYEEQNLRLLVENRFPAIWQPSAGNEEQRQLLLHRRRLVRMRTRIKNQLDSIAKSEGLTGSRVWKVKRRQQIEVAADSKRLGAEIGFLAILPTWSSNLLPHYHIHCVVPAGGLFADQLATIRPEQARPAFVGSGNAHWPVNPALTWRFQERSGG
jgi:hypothetical protein